MASCCSRWNFMATIVMSLAVGAIGYAVARALPGDSHESRKNIQTSHKQETAVDDSQAVATFGAGCFWCVEAVFEELDGVVSVESGYMGGHVDNPTYQQVSTGQSGHAEVARIVYDPQVVSYQKLLEVFWKTHDPTTLNRQGYDSGTQYRSAVFYHTEEQKQLAEKLKKELDKSGAFNDPIVTEITAASQYYPAEDYHQDYFNTNPNQRYCQAVIVPKMKKFREVFADDLKKKAGK